MRFDSFGIYGALLHFGLVVAIVGSAFLVFLYLWRKGRLDMDEEPALRMMQMNDRYPDDTLQEDNDDLSRH